MYVHAQHGETVGATPTVARIGRTKTVPNHLCIDKQPAYVMKIYLYCHRGIQFPKQSAFMTRLDIFLKGPALNRLLVVVEGHHVPSSSQPPLSRSAFLGPLPTGVPVVVGFSRSFAQQEGRKMVIMTNETPFAEVSLDNFIGQQQTAGSEMICLRPSR